MLGWHSPWLCFIHLPLHSLVFASFVAPDAVSSPGVVESLSLSMLRINCVLLFLPSLHTPFRPSLTPLPHPSLSLSLSRSPCPPMLTSQ